MSFSKKNVIYYQTIAFKVVVTHTSLNLSSDPVNKNDPEECCDRPPHQKHPYCLEIIVPDDDYFYKGYKVKCMDFVRSFPSVRPGCRLGTLTFICLLLRKYFIQIKKVKFYTYWRSISAQRGLLNGYGSSTVSSMGVSNGVRAGVVYLPH